MEPVLHAIGFLEGMADRLDDWARQSSTGGWSTHQVEANKSAANDCRREAAVLRRWYTTQEASNVRS